MTVTGFKGREGAADHSYPFRIEYKNV